MAIDFRRSTSRAGQGRWAAHCRRFERANEVAVEAFVNRRLDFPGFQKRCGAPSTRTRWSLIRPWSKFWKRMAGRGGMPRRDFTPAEGVSTEGGCQQGSGERSRWPGLPGCQPF